MRSFFACLLFSLISLCCVPPAHQAHSEPIKLMLDSTVALVEPEGARIYCSGTWVSDSEILTASHCVAHDDHEESAVGDDVYYSVDDDQKTPRLATVTKFYHPFDLALLQAKFPPSHPVAHLARFAPDIGDQVESAGHPAGMGWTYLVGRVAAVRVQEGSFEGTSYKVLQIDASFWKGDSGSAAFNADGDIVGVVQYLERAPNSVFACHLEHLREFLP